MAVYSNQLFRATSTTGFATLGANTFTATQTITPAANTNALAVTGYSLTGTNAQSLLDLAGTWNTSGVVDAGIKLVITNTASGAGSLLADLGTNAGSIFTVGVGGTISIGGPASPRVVVGAITGGGGLVGAVDAGGTSAGFQLTGTVSGTYDVIQRRDAAGILAQRNGTTAQTLRVYNTFTDASNYERGVFDWGTTANTLTIGTQAAGTGTGRPLWLIASASTWKFNANGFLNAAGGINLGGTGALSFALNSQISSATNGNILLANSAGTSFTSLQFGGTTSSFPALKVSSTTLQARLADDSAFTNIQGKLTTDNAAVTGLVAGALAALTNATLTITDSTGTVYRIPAITP